MVFHKDLRAPVSGPLQGLLGFGCIGPKGLGLKGLLRV